MFAGVAGLVGLRGVWLVCSAWVVCGKRDLGVGLAVLGACAWPCVQDGFFCLGFGVASGPMHMVAERFHGGLLFCCLFAVVPAC